MKANRILNALPLAFAAAALSVSPILAADTPTSTSASASETTSSSTTDQKPAVHHRHHHRDSFLSADEKAKIKSAKEKAFKDNPALKTEFESMKAEHKEMMEKWKSHGEKMKTAMLKADPTLKPTFDKMDARRKEWKKKFQEEHPDISKHDSD